MSIRNRVSRLFWRLIRVPPRLLYALGLGPIYGRLVLLLTTTGRKSGLPHVTPLQYEEVDGTIYVASARGQQADWFRNIVANPHVEVRVKSRRLRGLAEPITDPEQIADFLELRLRRHPRMIGAMFRAVGLPASPTRAQIEQYATQRALVAIRPAGPERFPITEEWNDSLAGDFLWSNVNFGEAVSDVMSPLSWTVLRLVLEDWTFLPGSHPVGNIGGRPYLNISIFASVLAGLGKSKQGISRALEGLLFMRLPEGLEIPLIPLSRRSLLRALPNLIRMQIRQKSGVRNLPAYVAENPAWCTRVQQQIQAAATKAELVSLWQEEIRPHLTRTVWTVLGSASHATDYTVTLRRELTELVGPEDADALISNLSDRSGLLASLGPAVGLAKVARGEMDREAYLEQYGHRGPHEFELSVPRPVEDPEWLDEQLAQFRTSPIDAQALLAQQRAEFDAAWQRFQARYPRKAKAVRRRIDEAARRNRMREAARSEYVRDRWMVRLFALRASELTGLGDDIFFLTMDEVLRVLAGHEMALAYIQARRETYARYKALPAYPSIIRGRFDPFQWAADPHRRTDFYDAHASSPMPSDAGPVPVIGSAGSAGRVEGVVRRLDGPEEGDQLQPGEILVTAQTDIAWTPLFPRAAAVVTDVGAPLSHAAIVARELGIPAVVGCGDATMRLRTGDRVRVDGGRGVVEILEAA